jgi:subtilase family serine protease
VRFYDGDPGSSGVQIGEDQFVSLTGCGDNQTVSVVWPAVTPGAHRVYVLVDPDGQVDESDESNNLGSQTILVATERAFTPNIQR